MYKILLVDDETFVLEGIRSSLPWKELGIEEVLCAQNGMQAMEVLKNNVVDLMITDIKMPIMDGIELIQQMHQQHYPCKVIVLSGFDNFEFAQEAITYNVVEYVLKPITLSKLRGAVEKAVSLVQKEENSEEHLRALERQFEAYKPVLTEHFISELLIGNLNQGLGELLQFDFHAKGYLVSVFHIDSFEPSEKTPLTVVETQRQLAVMDALNCVRAHVFEQAEYLTARVGSYDFALIFMLKSPVTATLPEQLDQLKSIISINKPYTFSVGIGNLYQNPVGILHSYEEANDALKYKLFKGNDSIIAYSDLYRNEGVAFPQLVREKSMVRNCLHTRDLKKLEELLQEIKAVLIREKVQDLEYIRQMAMEFIIAATLFLYEKNELPQKVICSYTNPALYVSKLETLDKIFNVVQDVYCQVIEYLNCKSELKSQHTIEIIRQFVQNNLSNEISLEILSQQLQLTPNYIGALFKQATNMYFSDYVMRERMEQAKVLLTDPVCRIYEVAAAVGYKNATYFSKLFKDYTGFNPTDFKK